MNASPAWLLVSGVMCDERAWGPQRDGLARDLRDIVAADLTRSASIEALARDALAQAPERFVLAGLSLGGIVAPGAAQTPLPDCGDLATLEAPNAVNDLLRRLSRQPTKEPA